MPQPVVIPYNDAYKGCKSWLDLIEPISLEGITPVLDDDSFDRKTKEISLIVRG